LKLSARNTPTHFARHGQVKKHEFWQEMLRNSGSCYKQPSPCQNRQVGADAFFKWLAIN
jgi:hypothetical protein